MSEMQNDPPIPPMQTGSSAQESQRLIEEIQNTGVVEAQDAAESAPARDENMTDGAQPSSAATPPITRS